MADVKDMHKPFASAQTCIAGHGGLHENIGMQIAFHQHVSLACATKGGGGLTCLQLSTGVVDGIGRDVPIQLGCLGADRVSLTDEHRVHDASDGRVFGGLHR